MLPTTSVAAGFKWPGWRPNYLRNHGQVGDPKFDPTVSIPQPQEGVMVEKAGSGRFSQDELRTK